MFWNRTLSLEEQQELRSSDALLERPDVAVVGGGVVGLATACFLAQSGATVQTLEGSALVCGSVGSSLGGVWPNHQADGSQDLLSLARRSRDLWARLAVRPEFRLDWRVTGLLDVTGISLAECQAQAMAAQESGASVTAVDAEQIAHLEPKLRAGFAAGLHFPSEAHLNPVKAALSFARSVRKLGSRVTTNATVTSAKLTGSRLTTLETARGRITPGVVVIATSSSLEWTQSWLPSLPLSPMSGHAVATDPVPPLLRSCVQGEQMVVQLRTGEITVGSDARSVNGSESVAEMIRVARELVPALKDVPFPYAWHGIRIITPDGWSIVDRAPSVENVWLRVGHFRHGLLLAPILGQLLAQSVQANSPVPELAPFRADRFAD